MPPITNSSTSSIINIVSSANTRNAFITSEMDLRLQTSLRKAETTVAALNMANFHISTIGMNNNNTNSGSQSPSCPFIRAAARKRENRSISTLTVTITLPQELSVRLDNTNIILIDCRSFMSFNKKHISGALNVNCTNPCFRRRLEKGKTTVGDLITSDEGKALFRSRSGKDVVVYDEDSQEIDNLPGNHPTVLVLKSLNKEGTRASLLRGGLKEFEFYYDGLCNSELKESPEDEELPPSPTPDSCQCPAIPDEPATELLPHLYIGNQLDAANLELLEALGISYVLNATMTLPCYHEENNVRYMRIAVKDNGMANLKCHFEEAIEFIEEARLKNKKVLLHCHAGISRSSTLAIAYIMKTRNMSMMQAYNFVKAKRPIIGPNMNFLGQLQSFEKTLSRSNQKVSTCARQAHRSRTSSPATRSFSFPIPQPET